MVATPYRKERHTENTAADLVLAARKGFRMSSSNVGPRRIDNHIMVDYASAAVFLHYLPYMVRMTRASKVSASKLAAARESGGHEVAISR